MQKNLKYLVYELYKLNPGIELRFGDPKYDPNANKRIFSSGDPRKIVLPEGYTADDLGTIKYNDIVVACVEPLKNINVGHVLPNSEISPNVTINNSKDLAIIIQKLNPDLIIYFADNNIYYRQLLQGDLGNIVLPDFVNYSNDNLQFSCADNGEVKNVQLKNYIEYKDYNSLESMYDLAFNNAQQYVIDKNMLESWERRSKIKELETKKESWKTTFIASLWGLIVAEFGYLGSATNLEISNILKVYDLERHQLDSWPDFMNYIVQLEPASILCLHARYAAIILGFISFFKWQFKDIELSDLKKQDALTSKDLQKLSRKNTQIK
ncbi:MAG: hypothetical protein IJO33_04095 [Bacilli bacterium]|nr:hypothetical protein [Bacilli bacterium]